MAYVDFTYYLENFHGNLIKDEATFRTFAERASEFIDTVTFDRLQNNQILDTYQLKVSSCACILAERYFCRNTADFLNLGNLPKTSESIGSYSVNFSTPVDYVQEISMSDADFQKSLKSVILRYLGNTGLLYRGVD